MSSGSSSSVSDPPFSYSMFDGLMVCYSIACMFYGLTIAQAYVYFRSQEKDPKWTTWMAGVVIGLETIHTAFFLQQMIFYLDYWTYLWWTPSATYALEITMEIFVNGFYIYRIWMVSKRTTLVAGMILIFVARIATFIFWLIRLTLAMHLVDNNGPLPMIDDSKLQMAFDATTSLAIGLDIAMTGAMIYYLRRCRAPNQRTRGVITWLLMYYVNTGAILASLSIAVLISVKVSGKEDRLSWLEPVHLGILNIFAKVMANSFFGVLNSRQLLRTKMAKHIVLGNNIFVRDSTLPDTNIEHIEISMETRKRVENI